MTASARGVGNRIAPKRYLAFVALFAGGGLAASHWLTAQQSVMAGFDLAASVFLASLWPLFDDAAADMRARARANDANRTMLLVLTALVTLAILVAVAVELAGQPPASAVAVVLATLALAWLFSNTVYAMHYAHLFYADSDGKGDDGGIDFPDTEEPDYWDFVYFSYTLGMTFQTSDVDVTGRHVRRVVIGHCLAAFVFNLGILAFTINVLGG